MALTLLAGGLDFAQFAPATTSAPGVQLQPREWAEPSKCVPEYSASASDCDRLRSTVRGCVALLEDEVEVPAEDGPFADCFCQQDLFSYIVECQNEHRQCIKDYLFDPEFIRYRDQWTDFCDSVSPSLDPTTPPLSKIVFTSNTDSCSYLSTACVRYTRYSSDCSSKFTRSSENSECQCQPHVQALESLCSIDGGFKCSKESVGLSELKGYQDCATFLGAARTWDFDDQEWVPVGDATPTITGFTPYVDFPLTYNPVPEEITPTLTPSRTGVGSGSISTCVTVPKGVLSLALLLPLLLGGY
ncbi:hypothetical protein FDECE_140 [Fusarium decemcellulare]|nr:hypothetical protein FDECE_140 [Fusarium decemcellulare]